MRCHGPIKGGLFILKEKRNIKLQHLRTSVVLEGIIWEAIEDILETEGLGLYEFCQMVDQRRAASSLTASLRMVTVLYYWSLTPSDRDQTPSRTQLRAPESGTPPLNHLPTVLALFQADEWNG